MKYVLLFSTLLVGSRLAPPVNAQTTYQPTWASLDKRPLPAWFPDAKFGIFIHWGVYSVPAYRPVAKKRYATYAEWYEADVYANPQLRQSFHNRVYGDTFTYRDFAPLFKAELFDPTYWADLFARSGARYVVLTSKHHDGFSLWPTKVPYKKGWNSMDAGPKRDLLGDLSRAVRAKGLKMGVYYSLLEWETTTTKLPHRPSGYYIDKADVDRYHIPDDQYVDGNMLPQLRELVTNYQPAVIFSDGEWDRPSSYWKSPEFLAWLYNNAPNKDEVVVNDRWGNDDIKGKHGDYFTSEYADRGVSTEHYWEENRGMGQSYGFNRAENIDDYNSSTLLIHQLIDVVSRGGNLLLNIGPAADGTIPVIMQQKLVDIGNWLSINGEAIYGTRPWRSSKTAALSATEGAKAGDTYYAPRYYTAKGRDVYVLATKWPDQPFVVEDAKAAGDTRVTLLGSNVPVRFTNVGGQLRIEPPLLTPNQIPSPVAYVFKVTNVSR